MDPDETSDRRMNSERLASWSVQERNIVFVDEPWIELYKERIELPTGETIDNFYQVEVPDHSVAVAYTPEQEILVERQYKHGLGEVALGFPAGFVDDGEKPLECARRELLEETGYEAAEWEVWGAYTVDGNKGFGRAHLFTARQAVPVAQPELEPSEEIEVTTMPAESVVAAWRAGEIPVLSHAMAAMLVALREGGDFRPPERFEQEEDS